MISVTYDRSMISTMINHDINHDIDYDIIANPSATPDGKSHSFGYGIGKEFTVSIPSCTGELGR